jgi:hypothetical protein
MASSCSISRFQGSTNYKKFPLFTNGKEASAKIASYQTTFIGFQVKEIEWEILPLHKSLSSNSFLNFIPHPPSIKRSR